MAAILTPQPTWEEAYEQFGRRYWTELMAARSLDVDKMVRACGIGRANMYRSLKRFKIALPRRGGRPTWEQAYQRFGAQYWADVMRTCGGNICLVARVSASNRADVYKKLKRFAVPLPAGSRGPHRGNWGDLSDEEPPRRATA